LVGVFAVANAVDGNCVFSFFEDDAVIAHAEAEESFELAAEGFHMASTGFGVAVNGLQDSDGGTLIDGANLSRHVRLKADFLHVSAALRPADLIHSEAALGGDLLQRETFTALAEVLP
jgi:hypothetical protein